MSKNISNIGFIYIIRAKDSNHYKVGFTSRDPVQRLSELQTGSPVYLELVHTWRGTMQEEKALHKALDLFNTESGGEWFNLKIGSLIETISYTNQCLLDPSRNKDTEEIEEPLHKGEYGPVKVIRGPQKGLEGFFSEDVEKNIWSFPEGYYSFLDEDEKVEGTEATFYGAKVYIESLGDFYLPYSVLVPS